MGVFLGVLAGFVAVIALAVAAFLWDERRLERESEAERLEVMEHAQAARRSPFEGDPAYEDYLREVSGEMAGWPQDEDPDDARH